MDISKKHGMDYRLLHAITSGHPWYGEWGYKFGAGSFAHTSDSYQEAVDVLSGIHLALYFSHRNPIRTPLQNTIALYWALSDRQLVTVRDLFRFIMHLLHQARKDAEMSKPVMDGEVESSVLCMWNKEDVDRAEAAMLKILRAVQSGRWVSWRALRGAASKAVDSQELLDYSLRGLRGKLMNDGHFIAVRCNAETSAIEYRLETYCNQSPVDATVFGPSVEHLVHDLRFLYDALLNPETMLSSQPEVVGASSHSAASKILDCKQFIKHYDESAAPEAPLNTNLLSVSCSIELLDHPKDYTAPPVELVLLPASATLGQLKILSAKVFQETYLMFHSFQAEQLPDFPNLSDMTLVKHVLGSSQLVRVRGRCTGDHRRIVQFRMERGLENWTVDCTCGAKDDDGERMMACDVCGVWQHTRCSGISDFEEVPDKFICRKCASPRKGKSRGGGGGSGGGRVEMGAAGRCKDEIGSVGGAGKFGRLATVG